MPWLSEQINRLGEAIKTMLSLLVGSEKTVTTLSEVLFSVIFLAAFFFIILLVRRLLNRFNKKLDTWRGSKITPIKIQTFEVEPVAKYIAKFT
jgi:hypothetical protein